MHLETGVHLGVVCSRGVVVAQLDQCMGWFYLSEQTALTGWLLILP